jgi:hypothetical protein
MYKLKKNYVTKKRLITKYRIVNQTLINKQIQKSNKPLK